MADERNTIHMQQRGQSSSMSHADPSDCPQSNHNPDDYQVVWEDNVDPDNMTYEELLELDEVVGSQNCGLSKEAISLLHVSKFKCDFFWRKKIKKGEELTTAASFEDCFYFWHGLLRIWEKVGGPGDEVCSWQTPSILVAFPFCSLRF
ncbi:hypothetical protein L6452_39176 [Arctium lappa]|uniref:Uncharacterized protein n=1 Tax=Arctium lappa TaxID=4217 RepID=A0ACB8XSA5_ARCLA|nr:hypothetical protein L6452_39176 [Arctium lappa]